ncbi:hypothetical protein [Parvularcula maris]|uniref:DUF2007 domain-containing protein n=1 Tax=Parvularcula maris TaxID=2965077 RepID=A0A9X2LA05_9PROT|nr:hypothetical protein [Parvularcula maris]MCQ8185698.1 hypothetical protein [Parvularcula maris]
MIEIARFLDPTEARVSLGFLRSQGLDVKLADEHALDAMTDSWIAMGGYRLLAAEEDAAQARLLLRPHQSKRPGTVCPNCGSERVRRPRRWGFHLLRTALIGGTPPPAASGKLKCQACGELFEDPDEP